MKPIYVFLLFTFSLVAYAEPDKFSEYTDPNLGISFPYEKDFLIIPNTASEKLTITIGDMVGNTLNGGITISLIQKDVSSMGYKDFVETELEKTTTYKSQISVRHLSIGEKYSGVEILREFKAAGINIYYTIIKMPNPNKVLTIHMVVDIDPMFSLLKERTAKALKQYSLLLSGLRYSET